MKKIFSILALALAAMTASAIDAPSFSLTKADGAEAHGTITFKVGDATVTSAAEGDVVTVILTPATGWAANQPSGQWYAAIAAAPRRTGIDFLADFTFTPVEGQENQWTFTMQRANAEVNFTYKKLMDNEDITVTIGDATYTGQPLTPTVTVKDGNTVLTEGTVYTLSYSNNTDAGLSTAGDKAPSVTITAKSSDGQYAGSVTKTFTIQKAAATISYETTAVNKTFGDVDFTNPLTMTGDGSVTYESDNESVATVNSESGLVHIVGSGNANIIATVVDGKNYTYAVKTAQYALTVVGYAVIVPAGEYVTYYKDEAVRLDEKDKNDIELCTITAVEDGKAVLSDNFDAMKANTPFLLKNTTNEEKTILLIPCNEPNLAVTVAKEFKGTEGPCVFSEELMATGDFYVCNGKEFIKVRGAGTLAANKAYLFVEGNNTPASIPFRRSIGGEGEGTTSIDNLNVNDNLNDNEATWYDLNGRKLNGKPAQKGIYIKNGKKIVVK
jgi:hypothetical protein